jgi:hypothetical protein
VIQPFTFGETPLSEGQWASIQCMVASGDLPLTIRWTFHGSAVAAGNASDVHLSTQKVGTRISLLTIDRVVSAHSGNYTCTAANDAGVANYTARLYVHG